MSIIYLNEPGLNVRKNGGKFNVIKLDGTCMEMPSGYVDCFVVMSNAQISNNVIKEMLCTGRQIIYMDKFGKVLGCLGADNHIARINLRQLSIYQDMTKRMDLARYLIKEKLKSQKKLLDTYNKNYKVQELKGAAVGIEELTRKVDEATDISSLMGLEGSAARLYYSCFGTLIFNLDFVWNGRKKHPAHDPINAMLSYGYFLLEKDVRIGLSTSGMLLDIGVLHNLDFRKESLVYDLMEPFRAAIVDRIVLKAINLRKFDEEDFIMEGDRCIFTDNARRRFISYYEDNVGCFEAEVENLRCRINAFIRDYVAKLKALAGDNMETVVDPV